MVLYLTKDEYKKLKDAITATKNPVLAKKFNHIFQCDENSKVFGYPTPDKDGIVITVDSRLFKDIMAVLASNGEELNRLFSGGVSIPQLPHIINSLKKVRDSLIIVCNKRR